MPIFIPGISVFAGIFSFFIYQKAFNCPACQFNFMKKLLLISLSLLFVYAGKLSAADGNYPVSAIPVSLKENANAVQRMEEVIFTIKSAGEGILKTRFAITILNEKGKKYASVHVGYDKLNKFNYLQGALYDANGRLIEKLKKSDIRDVSAISDNSLFEDTRVKQATFHCPSYPCTVEFEYETVRNNMLFYPSWTPQASDEHYTVEKSVFTVITPQTQVLRYKEINLPSKVSIKSEGGHKIYTWQIENLPVIAAEVMGPSLSALIPAVITAPTAFEIEGYQGNMESWKSLGKWLYDLNANRDQLPENVRQQVLQMVGNDKDPLVKARKIYEYLQKNTRYVSIQLGIGGWQTFEASTVAEKGYGDCKALTNYTKALLQVAGIPSYVASIYADDNDSDFRTDFPSNQFNHVILCIPQVKDTIWLECTSQTTSFGYLGRSTYNRYALLFTPDGGKLVKTPMYTAKDNLQVRKADIHIDAQGDAKAEVNTLYTGLQQEIPSALMHQLNPDEQKKYLYNHITLPSFEITKFDFTQQKSRIPAVTEKISLSVRKCVSKSGNRIFLTPNLLTTTSVSLPATEKRKTEIIRNMAYTDIDTIRYHLPSGYRPEYQPESLNYRSKFGEYAASVEVSEGVIIYIRRVQIYQGKYPAETYNELQDFYKKVTKADKMQLVFVNKS